MIKLSKPNIGQHEVDAVTSVLMSGNLVYGACGQHFEEKLKEFTCSTNVKLVSSGTAALHLALLALDIGPGDAVIVPDFTFPATINTVLLTGATPIIADVELSTYSISWPNILDIYQNWKGKERIKAVIIVHEFGYPCNMTEITEAAKELGIKIIEDAACALGAKHNGRQVGTFGDIGCFSFHPRKTVTTGEGGAVVTESDKLAEKVSILRNHGINQSQKGNTFVQAGFNYRLSDIQAAIGIVQLEKLPAAIDSRTQLVAQYIQNFRGNHKIVCPSLVDGHSWQTFMVRLQHGVNRDSLIQGLKNLDIESNFGAHSLSSLKYCSHYKNGSASILNGPELYLQGLALPLCENYSHQEISKITDAVSTLLESI